MDEHSINLEYLKAIFNFDLNIFLTGRSLLYIDSML
ncbi:hypothetical protein FLJU110815_04275 [Flavobacterium jumunjinense]